MSLFTDSSPDPGILDAGLRSVVVVSLVQRTEPGTKQVWVRAADQLEREGRKRVVGISITLGQFHLPGPIPTQVVPPPCLCPIPPVTPQDHTKICCQREQCSNKHHPHTHPSSAGQREGLHGWVGGCGQSRGRKAKLRHLGQGVGLNWTGYSAQVRRLQLTPTPFGLPWEWRLELLWNAGPPPSTTLAPSCCLDLPSPGKGLW